MISLDHTILRVRDAAESARFYQRVLDFEHEGRVGPFEVVRVNDGLTLDLRQQAPQHPTHLAFSLDRTEFEAAHRRLMQFQIPFGGGPSDRNSGTVGRSFGARGMADAVYFDDPDGHIVEIRTYEPTQELAQ
ncbi:MAG: VOC family protein [Gammaproteobacteria bacterium]